MNADRIQPPLDQDSIRVLLVDDDEFLKPALRKCLERNGCDVALADSAGEALSALASRSFDVVVTDLCIGEDSGLDLIKKVRQLAPSARIILMSGSLSPADREEALGSGAIAVLEKPFPPMDLSRAVQEASMYGRVGGRATLSP